MHVFASNLIPSPGGPCAKFLRIYKPLLRTRSPHGRECHAGRRQPFRLAVPTANGLTLPISSSGLGNVTADAFREWHVDLH